MRITEPLRLFTEVLIQLTPSGQIPNYDEYKIVSVTLCEGWLGIDHSFWGGDVKCLISFNQVPYILIGFVLLHTPAIRDLP